MIKLVFKFFGGLACLALLTTLAAAQRSQFNPDREIDLKIVIDLLADYSVIHRSDLLANGYWGWIDPNNRTITISDVPDVAARRRTVIHELLHAMYSNHGEDSTTPEAEALMAKKASELYERLWGQSAPQNRLPIKPKNNRQSVQVNCYPFEAVKGTEVNAFYCI